MQEQNGQSLKGKDREGKTKLLQSMLHSNKNNFSETYLENKTEYHRFMFNLG